MWAWGLALGSRASGCHRHLSHYSLHLGFQQSPGLFLNQMQTGNVRETCHTQVQFVAEISGIQCGAWDSEHLPAMVMMTLPLGKKLSWE